MKLINLWKGRSAKETGSLLFALQHIHPKLQGFHCLPVVFSKECFHLAHKLASVITSTSPVIFLVNFLQSTYYFNTIPTDLCLHKPCHPTKGHKALELCRAQAKLGSTLCSKVMVNSYWRWQFISRVDTRQLGLLPGINASGRRYTAMNN